MNRLLKTTQAALASHHTRHKMSKSPKVIIIGAGIGGLTLAQSLRNDSIPFEIYERDASASARDQGWALSLKW